MFGSFEGIGPAVAPVLRGEHSWRDWIVGRVTLAGLGTRARVAQRRGTTANVAQAFGLAEVGIKLRARQIVRPFFSLGAGVLRVTTEAQPIAPARAVNGGLWTPIADAGVGLRVGAARALRAGRRSARTAREQLSRDSVLRRNGRARRAPDHDGKPHAGGLAMKRIIRYSPPGDRTSVAAG